MYSTVRTAVLDGISAIPVQVEVDISTGMPVFDMVGNLTSEVREAKERVKTALHSVGIVLPAKRITVNLSPANIKKTGTGFDLPIAVAILTAMGVIDADSIKDCTLAGELNLNGEILPVSGILPIVFDEYNKGIGKFIIPKQNENEGRLVCGAKIFGISHLNDVIAQFDETAFTCQKTGMAHELQMDEKYADFCDVNGQKFIKRACEVAAGGMHNILLVGPPGAGKTVTLQCLGGRLREQGKRVIIIVPKKGHEFRPLCERLGGLYLRMSPSSKDCPNLMAIRRKSLDSYAKLKNIAARDDSVLADKIAQLIIWFSLKKKDLSEEDKSRLDSSLVEVYKRYGITFDNSTIVDENGNFRTMPTLSDWYEILYQEQDTRHLAVVLSRYVTGSAAAMAGRNDIELNNKYIVLDLSGMPDDMIADGTFWATSIAYDLIMNCEDELSALLADELWSLVGATANPQAAGFVLEMVKTIRGLGGIAVTSTQGMQDLFSLEGGSYGKGILDSSRIKLVMQMEEQEARLIQDKLNLSEDEVRQITRFRRGEGLLCIGYNHVPIAFHTTPKEYEAITTSPTDLRIKRTGQIDE